VATAASLTITCTKAPPPSSDIAAKTETVAQAGEGADPGATEVNPRLLRRFAPLKGLIESDVNPTTAAKVDLGRDLFYDTRLSKERNISCNTCHDLMHYGVDNKRTSPGVRGALGTRNTPTVYNAAGHFSQFWDGRAADVEEQAKMPVLNPTEMGMASAAEVMAVVAADPAYVAAFQRAFPGDAKPVTYDNLGRAIGVFERGLITPGRWDKYLMGDKSALTATEKQGLRTFLNVGCMVCHTGTLVGGSMFERVGVVEPWPNQTDLGRAEVTHAAEDRMMFKVPSLRNVSRTGPYFHDGSAATLPEAVQIMGRRQLGLDLEPAEVASIVSWLEALTGDIPREYITARTSEVAAGGAARDKGKRL